MHLNSLYKLRDWGDLGRPLCWEISVVVFKDGLLSVSEAVAGVVGSTGSTVIVPTATEEDKEATQARLCFAEFSGWVCLGGLIPC